MLASARFDVHLASRRGETRMPSSSHACSRRGAVVLDAAALALSLACNCGGGGGGTYSLDVSPTALAFAAERNSAVPAAKTLTVSFRGDGVLAGYPPGVSAPSWLSVDVASTTGTSAKLSISVNRTSLAPGDYRTTLRLVTGKQDGSAVVTKDLPVEYVVNAGLQASPASLAFCGCDGTAPAQSSVTLSSDVLPKAWTLAVEPAGGATTDWLVLPATSGTLSGDSADVQIGAAVRPPGSYTATLGVRDGLGSVRARIPVSYKVAPAVTLSGTLTARVTEAPTCSALALPLALHTQLDAASGAGHRWQATSTVDWLSVNPDSGDLTADSSLIVRLDPAKLWALANGPYGAAMTVASTQGGVTSASAPVALTVALSPALTAPASVIPPYAVGVAANPASLTRSISVSSNLGEVFAGRARWHASASAAWMQLTPLSATGGASLTLDLVAAELAGLADRAPTATRPIPPRR